jgi:hypothetical protein
MCFNLPKFLPSNLISEEPTESTWDTYIESLRNNIIPKVRFSVLPSPAWGVILSQTCDIENAKEDTSMIIAELNDYEDYHNIEKLSKKKYEAARSSHPTIMPSTFETSIVW